ncbi:MAG: hypothetical protein AAFN81_06710 [Bacteroidota bacterium]
MKITNFFLGVLLLSLLTISCQKTTAEIDKSDKLELSTVYATEIEAANVDKEMNSPNYSFSGVGTLNVSTDSHQLENEEITYTKVRYNGTRAGNSNAELYFTLGLTGSILPPKLDVEILYLEDQLVITDLSTHEVYVFWLNELNLPEITKRNVITTEVSFMGAFAYDPADAAKSGVGCECFCTNLLPGQVRVRRCTCTSAACGDYCYMSCRRSTRTANCIDACRQE